MNIRLSSRAHFGTLLLCVVMMMSGLGGCAQTQLAAHFMKSDPVPTPGGSYKVGRPYQVNGTTYVPRVEPDYAETGVASWYGADFHGKSTANGDIYNMNALTAAHRTLPMPSKVRVTNLENGRTMILTVNDRGPFVKDRVIDVSRRAAQLLGFRTAGTARVRVEAVPDQTRSAALSIPQPVARVATEPTIEVALASESQPASYPILHNVKITTMEAPAGVRVIDSGSVVSATALAPPTPVTRAAIALANESARGWFVQGGAFRDQTNAVRLSQSLSKFGPTRIKAVVVDGTTYYRVHVGPIYDPRSADKLLVQVVEAGHDGARLIID